MVGTPKECQNIFQFNIFSYQKKQQKTRAQLKCLKYNFGFFLEGFQEDDIPNKVKILVS